MVAIVKDSGLRSYVHGESWRLRALLSFVKLEKERASYNGSIEASQASDVGSIPIARSRKKSTRSRLIFHIFQNINFVARLRGRSHFENAALTAFSGICPE